jgi:chitinase
MIRSAFALLLLFAVQGSAATPRVVGYYAGWNREYTPDKIPADKLTHINYAFATIRDGEIFSRTSDETFRQFQAIQRKHPHIKTLISIGGWGGSGGFSDAALTPVAREKFARSCAAFMIKHRFDGIDIDWEYPGGGGPAGAQSRPEDRQNFTSLLAELRHHIDVFGKMDRRHFLLTIAAPAGNQYKRIELDLIHPLLDFLNLMTYDFAGPWSKTTGFNAPLFGEMSADTSVKNYLAAGVPREKLVLGVPFYGRAWGGVKDVNSGFDQPHDGEPPRAVGSGEEWSYRSIAEHYIDHGPKRFWSDEAKVPWLFDAAKGLMISYDDPQSLRAKANYAREQKLGGVMIWELSQDDAQSSLLKALHEGWEPERAQRTQRTQR